MLTKIDDLKEEPVVGRYYLVPCVRVDRQAGMTGGFPSGLWPVIGPLHDDLDDLDFHPKHWHLDCRFLTASPHEKTRVAFVSPCVPPSFETSSSRVAWPLSYSIAAICGAAP